MPLGIRPTVDFAFKLLFGSEENKDLLIHLLNSVLEPEAPVEEVWIENPFNEKSFEDDKLSIVDVKARDSTGAWYIIEVQTTVPDELSNRLVYYTSKLYTDQMREGQSYGELSPAASICFLSGSLFPDVQAGHLRFELYDPTEKLSFSDQFHVHLIELPKFDVAEEDLGGASVLDRWVYFMKASQRLEADQLRRLLPTAPFPKATGVLEMISRDPKLRQLYEDRAKEERDRLSMIKDTRAKALAEGEALGRAEGKAEGKIVGQIQTLQEVLDLPVTAESVLSETSEADLNKLISELREQIQNR
ncbi:MAG: Rpn family recombination-promoting nuclease/putative transposase [Pirellulales bacterium]|nr:Rpn family recombination-promoting nuclease/putative transposase [Pirellulales bacterium]